MERRISIMLYPIEYS